LLTFIGVEGVIMLEFAEIGVWTEVKYTIVDFVVSMYGRFLFFLLIWSLFFMTFE